ncbi:siderophore-interacting protein [Modestobacter sp. KNN46-3]|jgi:NADPH-dependent ferric siderophore reductase|uniref:siderophore-interacting protein n=1 Tax=Modestobacter sp. KNN46-3 TaxID=2711218 RepID=UPI0013E08070|nr:siderophore-interacting protein [Modestobacter sp. KNN46-3]
MASATKAERVRRPRVARVAEVLRTSRLTPHMIRVVLGGEGLAGFPAGEFTDHYVKLLFPPADAPYGVPFDPEQVRAELPAEFWPVTRTYTVRSWDPAAGELTIDFVHHGDTGLAGPWAANAQPGDRIQLFGPGGAYTPNPDADWHLLVGDESALPAIAAALPRLPGGVPAFVFLEVAGPAEQQSDLVLGHGTTVVWVHREGRAPGEALVTAVKAVQLPAGTGHVFVHGEAGLVKELRLHLRTERGLDPAFTSISGYWRQGRTEDRWQAEKPEWNAEVEAAEQALAAG